MIEPKNAIDNQKTLTHEGNDWPLTKTPQKNATKASQWKLKYNKKVGSVVEQAGHERIGFIRQGPKDPRKSRKGIENIEGKNCQ